MPSLRKKVWTSGRVTWDIRYRVDGKMKVYTIGETDRRTAEKIFHKFCNQLAEGEVGGTVHSSPTVPVERSLLLSDLARYARTYAEANKSGKTLEREQLAFSHLVRILGDIPVSEISAAKIEEYKAARLKEVTPTTINIEIRALNTALSQAMTLGWLIGGSPRRFKQIKTPESEPPQWLSEEQIIVLLSTEDHEFKRFLQFLLHTGCRRNEALGVMWGDVDLNKKQIVIRGQIGKMGKRRTIPINDTLHVILLDWLKRREGRRFPNYSSNQITLKFRRWARKIGLPRGISLHSLRATFACHLIKNGVDIYTVSRLLGHSSVKVTEKHYLALDPPHVWSAVNQLTYGAQLAGKGGKQE